jgi:RNA polymerase sigma factor (sigma-70 family)
LSQLVDTSPALTESPEHADEDAATLYDCYGVRIREYCYGQLRDRQEAEDAVQSTFLYAFTLLRRGETPRKPLPWLYTIAHNVCRTRRRALKRRSKVESGVALDSVQETIGRNDPQNEDLAHLASSLAALPLSQRTALLLREWQGLSYGEIAVELGLTESAVEAVLFRARRNLAKRLQYVSDRAATVAGAVLLLPSLRRLSSLGPGAKAAAATAFLVATALVPFADAPRTTEAAKRPATQSKNPLRAAATEVAQTPRSPRLAPLGRVTRAVTTNVPAAVPIPKAAHAAPAPTTPVAVAASTPAGAAATPQPVAETVKTTVDTAGKVVTATQTTVDSVESAVAGTVDTVTTTVDSVTSQVASTVPQVPTLPSPVQPLPQNTPLPGLP